jgi:hypothetical protein
VELRTAGRTLLQQEPGSSELLISASVWAAPPVGDLLVDHLMMQRVGEAVQPGQASVFGAARGHVHYPAATHVRQLAPSDQVLDDGDDEERVAIGMLVNQRGEVLDRVAEPPSRVFTHGRDRKVVERELDAVGASGRSAFGLGRPRPLSPCPAVLIGYDDGALLKQAMTDG